ncbi:MAG TPA: sn-glycerol-3-phosphate ABC transporter ATP-binding protein UgpC [Acidimicrobiia bacterium]|nr:sn-glycerol-3-phosphate ABC transporter ATP-binding protein UgpC [Acidimicrobiia bacterium]
MASIAFEKVGKVYPGGTRAISDVSIEINDGEFVVLVGPSGCGKSTLLRMVAGLEEVTDGKLKIGDRVVNDVPPKDRDIAMVFQNYALYPHMTVYDNMAFGLKLRKMSDTEIDNRVQEAAKVLEISDYLDRRPAALSGGQRQRVAMGRAIVREPAAFLMDEPLSNLDAKLRVQMRSEIGLLQERLGTTTLYVTHDQTEAMTMGDRVAVLRKISGEESNLQQIDNPRRLYDYPANLFVAGFIGSPAMNFVYGNLEEQNGDMWLHFAGESLQVDREIVNSREGLAGYAGPERVLGLRPEAFEIEAAEPNAPDAHKLNAHANLVEQLGSEAYVHFELDSPPVLTPELKELLEDQGGDAESLGSVSKFTARIDPDLAPDNDSACRLVVDTSKIHFFDKETGSTIR